MLEVYIASGVKKKIGYTTLKKEYSISCKDYITLGLTSDGTYIVFCGDSQLTYPVRSIQTANEYFTHYVNKI